MTAVFTLQEEEILHWAAEARRRGTEHRLLCFLYFSVFLMKAFLSSSMQRMLRKVAK